MSTLHTMSVGTAGPRVAFLHGLFGQGRNWNLIAKGVAGESGSVARCLLVDLPDHGRSEHTDDFSYPAYAAAVAATLREVAPDEAWIVVGHSLGGKVAMTLALTEPDLVDRLVVVDIAPKGYGDLHRFGGYIRAMNAMDLGSITSRTHADEMFAEAEPSAWVRSFLLQNLRRDHGTWRWQVNLPLVTEDLERGGDSRIAAFPFTSQDIDSGEIAPFERPVLWLVGDDSEYVVEHDTEPMRALFPLARLVRVKGAAHWVHTDAPEITIEALRRVVTGSQDAD